MYNRYNRGTAVVVCTKMVIHCVVLIACVISCMIILQVTLYARNELNIRGTTNLLLAYAANNHSCRPYLQKYFSACVRLPSDWIDVAEQYQVMTDIRNNGTCFPLQNHYMGNHFYSEAEPALAIRSSTTRRRLKFWVNFQDFLLLLWSLLDIFPSK